MLASKRVALKPLLESNKGIHLTAYLVNRGDIGDLKSQLRDVINQAYEWISPVMGSDDRNRFLEPLDSLLTDAKILSHVKGNVGLFRNADSFRILSLPVEVEPTCHVATTFHVKPLLRWLQIEREFLLIGVSENTAHVYSGSQETLKLLDVIAFPSSARADMLDSVADLVDEMASSVDPKVFFAGKKGLLKELDQRLKCANVTGVQIAESFDEHNTNDVCESVREYLRAEARAHLEKVLSEFKFADGQNRTKRNIFQIAKAVIQGRVRKLIVTDELNIFGKIDAKTGGLSIHPFDLDHEDDDILDDLAQLVLQQGGEVVVASRNEIPKGRPILAILDGDVESLEKLEDQNQFEIIQERFG